MNMQFSVITWRLSQLYVDAFESVILPENEELESLQYLAEVFNGIFYVQTCQRVILVIEGNAVDHFLEEYTKIRNTTLPTPEIFRNEEGLQHLIEVVASLDSMVLGETEIQGQFKHAVDQYNQLMSPFLVGLLAKILRAGKNIRNNSKLKNGKISTIVLVEEVFRESLQQANSIGIIGTGKMAKGIVRFLIAKYSNLYLYTQHDDRVGLEYKGIQFRHIDDLAQHDVIITATNTKIDVCNQPMLHDLLLIDLGVPHNCPRENLLPPSAKLVDIKMLLDDYAASDRGEFLQILKDLVQTEIGKIAKEYKMQKAKDKITGLRADLLELAAMHKEMWLQGDLDERHLKKFDQFVNTMIHRSQTAIKDIIINGE